MASMGFCPSGRLFEAAACGATMLTDAWPGLGRFFAPDDEVLIVPSTEDVMAALRLPEGRRRQIGEAARARVSAGHTWQHRAAELEALLFGRGTLESSPHVRVAS
jgi:spore maturation protein CgeB